VAWLNELPAKFGHAMVHGITKAHFEENVAENLFKK
jgi:hypothetical protein